LASGAILIGFNVRADATARKLIAEKELDVHYYAKLASPSLIPPTPP
jgi:translation initiation factor IF-2